MPAWCPQVLFKSYLCIQFWLCRVFTAAWLSCSCGEWRLLWLWCVGSSWRWPLLLWSVGLGVWAQWRSSQALEHTLSGCGARALLLCGMRGLPGLGTELVSSVLANRFLATEPPGKHPHLLLKTSPLHL